MNCITAEDTQMASAMVLGMFTINSNPATVLFDSGATRSFISSRFVAKYNLHISFVKFTMLVFTPGGKMESRNACHKLKLKIRGVDFSTNLIVMDSNGVDVILGMDWLTKNQVVIDCATKYIQLTHPDGSKVEHYATGELVGLV